MKPPTRRPPSKRSTIPTRTASPLNHFDQLSATSAVLKTTMPRRILLSFTVRDAKLRSAGMLQSADKRAAQKRRRTNPQKSLDHRVPQPETKTSRFIASNARAARLAGAPREEFRGPGKQLPQRTYDGADQGAGHQQNEKRACGLSTRTAAATSACRSIFSAATCSPIGANSRARSSTCRRAAWR